MAYFAVFRRRTDAWENDKGLEDQWTEMGLLETMRIAPWNLRLGSLS